MNWVSRICWALTGIQVVGWWVTAGLFAFGAIGPIGEAPAMYLALSALIGTGGTFAAAAFPAATS